MRRRKTSQCNLPKVPIASISTRSAFWSGNLSEKKWLSIIRNPEKHPEMTKTFFNTIPVDKALFIMGRKTFVDKWPLIRNFYSLDERKDRARQRLFDAAWSVIVTGDSQYPVTDQVANLSKGNKELLARVIQSPGISIYQLTKMVERDYSRVHKEVTSLKDTIFELKKEQVNGRSLVKVFARYSINTKLAEHTPSGRQPNQIQ